jgi:hypothetical protein
MCPYWSGMIVEEEEDTIVVVKPSTYFFVDVSIPNWICEGTTSPIIDDLVMAYVGLPMVVMGI